MLNWAPVVLAIIMILFLERPGEKESRLVSGIIYFVLGVFPLSILTYSVPLGLPVAAALFIRKVDYRALKVIAALAGAGAGWIYFTWFWTPG